MQTSPAASPLVRAHVPLRNHSASSRLPARQARRRKPQPQRSTADNIRAARMAWQAHLKQQGMRQAGTANPDATDEAAQRRLQEIEQAVQSEMAPETTSDTSMNMTYENILNRDHNISGGHAGDMPNIPGQSANDMQEPAQSQCTKSAQWPRPKAPIQRLLQQLLLYWVEHQARLRADPIAAWTRGSLLDKAYYCIMGLAVIFAALVAGLVMYAALCQIAKIVVSCAVGATRPHTWLIILGLIVIALITPQAPKVNGLLRFVDDYNMFANYGQAKHAISLVTWSSIALFLLFVFVAGSV